MSINKDAIHYNSLTMMCLITSDLNVISCELATLSEPFNPLTTGDAYIRFFNFLLAPHFKYGKDKMCHPPARF